MEVQTLHKLHKLSHWVTTDSNPHAGVAASTSLFFKLENNTLPDGLKCEALGHSVNLIQLPWPLMVSMSLNVWTVMDYQELHVTWNLTNTTYINKRVKMILLINL